MWATVTAPDAPGVDGDGEQAKGTDDQQRRQQDEVLWPEGGAEDVELAVPQVPQYGLAAVPVQPGRAEEQHEQGAGKADAQVTVKPGKAAGMDAAVGASRLDAGWGGGDLCKRDSIVHGSVLIRPRSGMSTMALKLLSAQVQILR
ncbi:hypothetical protein D3C76_872920 [compost metagenome]